MWNADYEGNCFHGEQKNAGVLLGTLCGFHTVEARNIWKEYTEDYYHMDTYYRQYHSAFGKSLTMGNDHLDDLFKQVTDRVEGLYTHWFLGELGNNWSDACADELIQYGRILGSTTAGEFL